MSRNSDVPAESGDTQTRAHKGIAPIYRHLPRGPHNLNPREIEAHQRARIHGAMVEAVARAGYEGVTVRQVIGLAGVSRRSFYEQFANRHDCFLMTARSIAARELRRAADACRSEQAFTGRSLAAALARLAASAGEQPNAFRLVLGESLSAGDGGAALLGEVLGACERMIAPALSGEQGAVPPGASVRAMVGSLHGMLAAALRERRGPAGEVLAGEMSATALALRVPSRAGAADELASRLRDRARRAALAASTRAVAPAEPDDPRERMLRSALRLAADQPAACLSGPEIADGAGVPVDAFLEAFPNRGECLEAALACSGERLKTIALRAESAAADWPQAVRLGLAGMLGHLAANPAQARGLALVAHRAGPAARSRSAELEVAIGDVLTRGGPRGARAAEAAAGALWHTVRQALIDGRQRLLPAFSDHLAYAVLAPAVGPDAAIAALRGPC
ncbi:MAG: TetR family transcriptional regulator [Solirubrobacterales bacterium]|nr:TetR family transcriptional regulator [Solirubrobacterales bacterium]